MYNHWFFSRQKRSLVQILPALIAFNDTCVGKVWSGNAELQLEFEDELARRSITQHGNLRSRRTENGGGGGRTLFKEMKDLGLIFTEEESRQCRLTLIAEELVKGNISFVEAMRIQLKRYQYPSAASWQGKGAISHDFKVHPFQFMFRLLMDPRLEGYITMDETQYIVIFDAMSDSNICFENVVSKILAYRAAPSIPVGREDDVHKTYWNIANTLFNYISLTQYVDRPEKKLNIRHGKEEEATEFVESNPRFILNPEYAENYLRAYGRGNSARDLRDFTRQREQQNDILEARINEEYVLLALETPITGITSEIVSTVSMRTGIDERTVSHYLEQNHSHGNIDDFFINYKELANMGRVGATAFEAATCEMFRKVFGMRAEHVGQSGNTPTPDVIVYADDVDNEYCGIIDNKAYREGFTLTGNFKRVMKDEYIPNYKTYGNTNLPLAFFSYISGSFGSRIDSQLQDISSATGVPGSAMSVDILIDFAQDYMHGEYNHGTVKRVFSTGHEVTLADIGR